MIPSASVRWDHLSKVLCRTGPFAHPDFEASPEILRFLQETCRILIIGAGGLGCELLKDLALMGFGQIDVIDMDTIDVSNLNRQFLFRSKDIGKSKAEVAAKFIHDRVSTCKVIPHCCRIQDYDASFYSQFHIVVSGLDSIVARRWINGMLVSLLRYNDDGSLDQSSLIPLVDGGTEGFKGNCRVILPGLTPCIECTLDLFPPQINFPLCTIAHTPRLPEHCIEWARVLLWAKDNPWGEDTPIDGDNPDHIQWIYERATERAKEYGIQGITYRLTQGVIKHIIAAVASTNAIVAAQCATEVFKIATSCAMALNNYMVFSDLDGIYSYTYEAEKKPDCAVCSVVPKTLEMKRTDTLQDLVNILIDRPEFQMKRPGITTTAGEKLNTLYMPNVAAIEVATRPNLKKMLPDLGLENGAEITVADVTSPTGVILKLRYVEEEGMNE